MNEPVADHAATRNFVAKLAARRASGSISCFRNFQPIEGWIADVLGPERGPKIMVSFGGIAVALGWFINAYATSLEMLSASGLMATAQIVSQVSRAMTEECGAVIEIVDHVADRDHAPIASDFKVGNEIVFWGATTLTAALIIDNIAVSAAPAP